MAHKLIKTTDYILVVDDSLTIGKGYAVNRDYEIMKYNTDEHLAYDSYAVKKIIAHLPLNGSPILEGVDLLPPYSRHQEDGVDDAVIRFKESWIKLGVTDFELSAFSEGYNKAREKYVYTEDDIRQALFDLADVFFNNCQHGITEQDCDKYQSIILQALHQYPTEFECEMIPCDLIQYSLEDNIEPDFKPKTITTTQGIQWVGKYK
jgi:hypothetical protein